MIAKLDSSPLGIAVRIARIDWTSMSHDEGRRLREFGFDTFTHQKPVLKRGFFGESLMA